MTPYQFMVLLWTAPDNMTAARLREIVIQHMERKK